VRQPDGRYLPAAIYLGGSDQTVVRAIDSAVVDLFLRAEVSANGGDNNIDGGKTHSSFITTIGGAGSPGAVQVTLLPAAAASAGGWRLRPETSYRGSEAQISGLRAGSYVLEFKPIPGYQTPAPQTLVVSGGTLTQITNTYEPALTPLQSWRLANFGTPDNTGPAADDADPDGDGQPNLAEFTAGAEPTNPRDFFRALTTERTATSFTITASGKAGRVYVMERATAPAGPWEDVATTATLPADAPVTLTDQAPPAGTALYRLRVTLP
jgi:hypothetical protein